MATIIDNVEKTVKVGEHIEIKTTTEITINLLSMIKIAKKVSGMVNSKELTKTKGTTLLSEELRISSYQAMSILNEFAE